MIAIACVLIYLAIGRQFEPLLLLPISFGMLLVNLMPGIMAAPTDTSNGGLFYYLYQGVKLGIYPPLIFLGIGAMTDFGPLIANPKSFLLGAAAQLGIFITFIGAILLGFDVQSAGSIGIIGGADGPTAIFVTSKLKPELLGPIAVAAYSYMALVPIIQPPIMKLLTTKKERAVVMEQLRPVSKLEKILFRRTDGRSCFSEGRPGRESQQLPADARYGSQCGRRNRLRCCRRRSAGNLLIRFPTFLDLTDASIIIYPDACPRPGKLLYAVCRTSKIYSGIYRVYGAVPKRMPRLAPCKPT